MGPANSFCSQLCVGLVEGVGVGQLTLRRNTGFCRRTSGGGPLGPFLFLVSSLSAQQR
jgi:hypothetical protein